MNFCFQYKYCGIDGKQNKYVEDVHKKLKNSSRIVRIKLAL